MASQESSQGRLPNSRPDGKVFSLCSLSPLLSRVQGPSLQTSSIADAPIHRQKGPNQGKVFWNCQQSGDFCKSFLWDHEVDFKPIAWRMEFLKDPDRADQPPRPKSTSSKLALELVSQTHFEAKIVPSLLDNDFANAVAPFSTGNPHPTNPSCWRVGVSDYQNFIDAISPLASRCNIEILYLPEWILKRYVDGTLDEKTQVFDHRRIPDALWTRLLPFQKQGIEQVVSKFNGRCIIADEMGLGKTIQAVGLLSYYRDDLPVLIVTPSSLRFHWKETLLNWLPDVDTDRIHVINSGSDWPKHGESVDMLIVSYSLLFKFKLQIQEWNPRFTILDESHFIKTLTTQRSKAAAPIIKESARAILLSGTPATSRPSELYSQVDVLHHGMLGTYQLYGVRYCNGRAGQYGWECRGAQYLRELNVLLTDTVMIRRLKKDVMQDLPPKFRTGITVSLLSEKVTYEFKTKLRSIKDFESSSSRSSGILAGLYRETGLVKIKDAAALVVTKLKSSDSEKFLVFAHHQDVLDGLESELRNEAKSGAIVSRIDGKTNQNARRDIVEKFQTNPKHRVLILSIMAASVGLTLTAASNVVFAELAWNPQDLLQAEDRVHRIGQGRSHVSISYLLARGTLDDIMWPMVQRKWSVCNATMDAGRGASINVDFDHHERPDTGQRATSKRRRADQPKVVRGPMDRYISVSSSKPSSMPTSDGVDLVDLT